MIQSFTLENFGPIQCMEAKNLGKINLILAENSKGKTFILKALYSVIKSHEEAHKGKNNRSFEEELRDKLYWTFQVDKIGDLVSKGSLNVNNHQLKMNLTLEDNTSTVFSFGSRTEKEIKTDLYKLSIRQENSIFLPPKEVLSLFDIINQSKQDKSFGFDATYVDLVEALSLPTTKGRNFNTLAKARQSLEDLFDGIVRFDDKEKKWIYKKGKVSFSINATAEGVKKIGILETLLGNRFLSSNSIIFIDEPESNLHPKAISQFLDILFALSQLGIQIFMATHSYFVIKKMHLLAKQHTESVPVLMSKDEDRKTIWIQEDLIDGMPENEIINESIRLFKEETDLIMDW